MDIIEKGRWRSRAIGLNESLWSEGYIVPRAFTAHHLVLYWFSRLAQATQLLRESRLVEVVELELVAIPTVDNPRTVHEQGQIHLITPPASIRKVPH